MAKFINLWSIFLFKFEIYMLIFKLEKTNRPKVNKSCHIYMCIRFWYYILCLRLNKIKLKAFPSWLLFRDQGINFLMKNDAKIIFHMKQV